jgi:RNA polymerase sigma factor (sigma-70 family)
MELEEEVFRRDAGRLVGIVTRLFGFHNLALAEDVVQDAFCRALETWKFHGVPENPSAWLMTAAKHRALDVLRRERTARNFAADLGEFLESEWTLAPIVDEAFDAAGITDVELRMMFSLIHPSLPEETQVALVLNLLCGFSVAETAAAFLKNAGTMERRLTRAKRSLAETTELFNLAGAADVAARLPVVLRALYLLFNEGYHGASALYDTLMAIQPSPVVALNRAVAVAQRDGPARGLEEIRKIEGCERLGNYPFYLTAVAEFELRLGHEAKAHETFATAMKLARNPDERRFLQSRMRACRGALEVE